MRRDRYVSSAERIAFVRARLTDRGVLDDPLAEHFLHPGDNWIAKSLLQLERTGLWPNRPFAYIAARTRFYDTAVNQALDAGIRQAAILGAGYDSRAWRLGREGVIFFEVDHPDVQGDKRQRSPADGPRYVSVDLATDSLSEALLAAGFRPQDRSVILCEGLTMYLTERSVARLLGDMAALAASTSRLAIDFAAGAEANQRIWRFVAAANDALYSLEGAPLRFRLHPSQASRFLADCGWAMTDVLTGPEMHARFLSDTQLPVPRSIPGAYVASAVRQ